MSSTRTVVSRVPWAVTAVLAVLCCGCLPSLSPVYLAEDVVTAPPIQGQWTYVDDEGVPRSSAPWTFGTNVIETVGEKGQSGTLKVTYFKVGTNIFMDTTVDDARSTGRSEWWLMHVIPSHQVCKVQFEPDRLTILPINYGWMRDALDAGTVTLRHTREDDVVVFSDTPEAWRSFLLAHGSDTNAFSRQSCFHFRRVTEATVK